MSQYFEFEPRVKFITTGTTPIEVVAQSKYRQSMLIVNTGGVTVYISPEQNVSATNGFTLEAGASLAISYKNDGKNVGIPFYAYSAAAGELNILEL